MRKLTIFAVSLLIQISACASPSATQPATFTPSVPLPEDPTYTPYVITATAPAVTMTPMEGGALEAILMGSPGPGSRVASPVTVQGQSRPTFEQNLVVAVYGENGEQLALQPTTIQAPFPEAGEFSTGIAFLVAAEQPGRISVYETSAMDGGILHLSSVEVTLLPSGAAQIDPAPFHFESILISVPQATAQVGGGIVTVSGFSDYYFEANLGLVLCGGGGSSAPNELCGTEDNILTAGNAFIDSADLGQPGPFSGELSYTITEPTPARIVVYAASPRDGGLLHLASIPITLLP
jgi:hypothetical protein